MSSATASHYQGVLFILYLRDICDIHQWIQDIFNNINFMIF